MLLPRYLEILTTSSSGRESNGELGNAAAIFCNYLSLKSHKWETSHCKLCLCFTSAKKHNIFFYRTLSLINIKLRFPQYRYLSTTIFQTTQFWIWSRMPNKEERTWNINIVIQNIFTKISKIWSGMFIPVPGSGFFSIPDPWSRVSKLPDPNPQQCVSWTIAEFKRPLLREGQKSALSQVY